MMSGGEIDVKKASGYYCPSPRGGTDEADRGADCANLKPDDLYKCDEKSPRERIDSDEAKKGVATMWESLWAKGAEMPKSDQKFNMIFKIFREALKKSPERWCNHEGSFYKMKPDMGTMLARYNRYDPKRHGNIDVYPQYYLNFKDAEAFIKSVNEDPEILKVTNGQPLLAEDNFIVLKTKKGESGEDKGKDVGAKYVLKAQGDVLDKVAKHLDRVIKQIALDEKAAAKLAKAAKPADKAAAEKTAADKEKKPVLLSLATAKLLKTNLESHSILKGYRQPEEMAKMQKDEGSKTRSHMTKQGKIQMDEMFWISLKAGLLTMIPMLLLIAIPQWPQIKEQLGKIRNLFRSKEAARKELLKERTIDLKAASEANIAAEPISLNAFPKELVEKVKALIKERRSFWVYAPQGWGKSALKKAIASAHTDINMYEIMYEKVDATAEAKYRSVVEHEWNKVFEAFYSKNDYLVLDEGTIFVSSGRAEGAAGMKDRVKNTMASSMNPDRDRTVATAIFSTDYEAAQVREMDPAFLDRPVMIDAAQYGEINLEVMLRERREAFGRATESYTQAVGFEDVAIKEISDLIKNEYEYEAINTVKSKARRTVMTGEAIVRFFRTTDHTTAAAADSAIANALRTNTINREFVQYFYRSQRGSSVIVRNSKNEISAAPPPESRRLTRDQIYQAFEKVEPNASGYAVEIALRIDAEKLGKNPEMVADVALRLERLARNKGLDLKLADIPQFIHDNMQKVMPLTTEEIMIAGWSYKESNKVRALATLLNPQDYLDKKTKAPDHVALLDRARDLATIEDPNELKVAMLEERGMTDLEGRAALRTPLETAEGGRSPIARRARVSAVSPEPICEDEPARVDVRVDVTLKVIEALRRGAGVQGLPRVNYMPHEDTAMLPVVERAMVALGVGAEALEDAHTMIKVRELVDRSLRDAANGPRPSGAEGRAERDREDRDRDAVRDSRSAGPVPIPTPRKR